MKIRDIRLFCLRNLRHEKEYTIIEGQQIERAIDNTKHPHGIKPLAIISELHLTWSFRENRLT